MSFSAYGDFQTYRGHKISEPPNERTKQGRMKRTRTLISVVFILGSSSSKISAGSFRINFPNAINPYAYVADFVSAGAAADAGAGSAWNARRAACMVVRP